MASLGSDPSIYAQVGQGVPQPANMLTGFGQVAQTGNALVGLQNAQKLMAARQAIGQNVQAATDPNTGAVDTGKLNVLNAQTPAAAYGAQDSATTNQALQSSQQGRATQAQTTVNQGITSALTLPDAQQNRQTYMGLISSMQQSGAISAQDAQAAEADLPQDGNSAAFRQYAARHLTANLAGPQAVQAIFGSAGAPNVGGQIVPGQFAGPLNPNKAAGSFASGGTPLRLTTGPDKQAELVSIQDPNGPPGQQITVPRSSLPNSLGLPPSLVGPGGLGNGRPQAPGTPAQAPLAPGGVIQGANPNLAASNAADTGAFTQAKAGAPQIVTDTQTLSHALDALKVLQADSLGTGLGSDAAHKLYSYATTLRLATPGMQDDATAYDLAKKNLTRYAASQGQAAHSDLGLSTAAASNASVDAVTNDAAQTVVKQELGRKNQALAALNTAPDQKTGLGYTAHVSSFSQNTDPRAFAFDSYSGPEQAKIIQSLGGKGTPAWKKFTRSLAIAKQNGMIQPPSAPNGN